MTRYSFFLVAVVTWSAGSISRVNAQSGADSIDCVIFGGASKLGIDAILGNCIPCGYYSMNFGGHPDFATAAWTNGGAQSDMRSLLHFDLGSIPTTATVVSATLSLYFNPISPNGDHQGLNTSRLERVTSPWDEHTVTWATQPTSDSLSAVLLSMTTSNNEDRPSIDVASLVQGMVSDPANNFGFLFRQVEEIFYRRMIFSSSDHPDASRRPQLEVCYQELTTGVASTEPERTSLSAFPMPFTDRTEVDLRPFGNERILLVVHDLQGRLVREMQAKGGGWLTLDRGDLPNGAYVLIARQGAIMASTTLLVAD